MRWWYRIEKKFGDFFFTECDAQFPISALFHRVPEAWTSLRVHQSELNSNPQSQCQSTDKHLFSCIASLKEMTPNMKQNPFHSWLEWVILVGPLSMGPQCQSKKIHVCQHSISKARRFARLDFTFKLVWRDGWIRLYLMATQNQAFLNTLMVEAPDVVGQ